jgi:poly(A) polymerase
MENIFDLFDSHIRLVGGAVRSYILNQPVNDFDFSCNLQPDEVKKKLDDVAIKYLTIGEKFGTITAIINNEKYEITSTREDIKTDGRWAEIKWTNSFEIDSERRDFTFNSLYMDRNKKIYDYHNGIQDLYNGNVKFIGIAEKRIIEDYLRILRFFRFQAFYGKSINEDAIIAINNLKHNLIKLSKERIKSEIFKIFSANNPIPILNCMNKMDILSTVGIYGNCKYLDSFYKNKFDDDILLPFALFIDEIPNNWPFSKNEKKKINLYLKDKNSKIL